MKNHQTTERKKAMTKKKKLRKMIKIKTKDLPGSKVFEVCNVCPYYETQVECYRCTVDVNIFTASKGITNE